MPPAPELPDHDPLAQRALAAARAGDVAALESLLAERPELARTRFVSSGRGCSRTLLHAFADWPGHRPNAREIVRLLHAAGADLDAPSAGEPSETALHWAASCDDVELLDALLDAGADLEARGAVIAGGTALADATAFGQWRAAERLIERGAYANLFEAAVMGLDDRIRAELAATPGPAAESVTHAFWGACHGGRQTTAATLLAHGADLNWIGWDGLTPLDAARRSEADGLVTWLEGRGASSAPELA